MRFPFLIGTVRTLSDVQAALETIQVSIPHRYGKNQKNFAADVSFSSVSIPHRYGKNGAASRYAEAVGVFPFLIGTVRTEC